MKRGIRRSISVVALLLALVMGTSLLTSASVNPDQTAATTSSVTLSWNAVANAAYYEVWYYPRSNESSITKQRVNAPATSYTISLPADQVYYAETVAFDSAGGVLDTSSYRTPIACAPGEVSGYKATDWGNGTGGYFKMKTNPYPNTMSKVEWQLLTRDGKSVKASGTTTSMGFYASNVSTNQVYQLGVRGCVRIDGRDFYGPWHYKKVVPQPKMKKLKLVKKKKIKVSWRKVKGATKYIVYASTKPNKGFKKVGTVKGSKSSLTVSKVKGKKLRKYKTYYFKVQAVSGNTKSTKSNYVSGYIYTTRK